LLHGYFRNGIVSPGFTACRGSIITHPVCSVSMSELTTLPRRSTSKSARSCLPCHFKLMRTVLSRTVCFNSVRLSTSECTLITNAVSSLLLILFSIHSKSYARCFRLCLTATKKVVHSQEKNYGSKRILRDFSPFFIISKPFLYSSSGSRWVTTPSVGSLPSLIASMTNG
jgi:hypothetical protein